MLSLQSANRDPYDTHSPQSPFGPVFEGRTHSEGLSSNRWASCVSSPPSVPQHSTLTASHSEGIVEFISLKTCGEMSVLPLSSFSLYIPTGNITATTLAPAPF